MKIRLLAFATITALSCFGQNLNNPSFDSVYFGGIDRILRWVTSDGVGIHATGLDTVQPLQANTFFDASNLQYSEILDFGVFIDTTPYSNWALRLKTQPQRYKADGSRYESYIVNGDHFYTDSTGYIDFSKCGTPFTGRPTSLNGYYKLIETSAQPNFGRCEILLKKFNSTTQRHDTVAYVDEYIIFNPAQNWEPFNVPITYLSSATPDSIVVVFKAAINPNLPATFWVDELSFSYSGIGLKENEEADFFVTPNPVTTVLHTNTQEADFAGFSIVDQTGQLCLRGKDARNIQVAELNSGMYFLLLTRENGSTVPLKFIKN